MIICRGQRGHITLDHSLDPLGLIVKLSTLLWRDYTTEEVEGKVCVTKLGTLYQFGTPQAMSWLPSLLPVLPYVSLI